MKLSQPTSQVSTCVYLKLRACTVHTEPANMVCGVLGLGPGRVTFGSEPERTAKGV